MDEYERLAPGTLYIKGYTETLELVKSIVRVIPNVGFVKGLPEGVQKYFKSTGLPCYRIAIKNGREHYGFVLRGMVSKYTPTYTQWLTLFNMEAIYADHPYLFVCEGIKDCYLFLKHGMPAIAMLTSNMREEVYEQLAISKKVVVFVPDADQTGREQSIKMAETANKYRLKYCVARIRPGFFKDFGDFWDLPESRDYIVRVFKNVLFCAKQVYYGDKHYVSQVVSV
jgi:hypothetical protein